MKKFLKTILFLCALSSIAYAEDDAMAILNKKRAEIEKAEKAKPKTEAEKLEATRKEALEKLDFYERVVRSVAREEAEVAGYYQIMDEDIKTTEAIEEATPVVEPVQQ